MTLVAFALLGCSSADDAVKSAEKAAKDKASELADDASKEATRLGDEAASASKKAAGELADKAVDASKTAASDLATATKDGARSLYDDLRNDGELSSSAKEWFATRASETSIESIVVKGAQLAPVALEASKVLLDAVDRETVIEPIFQKIDDDPAKVDAAIGDMPRVEVIEDVTVGFRQMERLDSSTHVAQKGFLVMWRHEDYLVGFVYRSTRTIDLDALVAETPRLLRLTEQALTD